MRRGLAENVIPSGGELRQHPASSGLLSPTFCILPLPLHHTNTSAYTNLSSLLLLPALKMELALPPFDDFDDMELPPFELGYNSLDLSIPPYNQVWVLVSFGKSAF
jgi:hypothetical protein